MTLIEVNPDSRTAPRDCSRGAVSFYYDVPVVFVVYITPDDISAMIFERTIPIYHWYG